LKDWPVVGGEPQWRLPSWVGKTIESSESNPRTLDQLRADFGQRLANMEAEGHWNVEGIRDINNALDAIKAGTAQAKRPGHMYEVNINAHPDEFLDWDKPLSEQSQHVQDAIKKAGLEPKSADLGSFGGRPIMSAPRWADTLEQAQALRDAGIKGIKYLDQDSRAAGEGSRNFVVFDDKLIDIIKKYGLAGLISGGAAAPYLPGRQQQ
jgi:hypothetical protein